MWDWLKSVWECLTNWLETHPVSGAIVPAIIAAGILYHNAATVPEENSIKRKKERLFQKNNCLYY